MIAKGIRKDVSQLNDSAGAGNASLNTFKGINFDGCWSFLSECFLVEIDELLIFRGDF